MNPFKLSKIKERASKAICSECEGLGRLPAVNAYSVPCQCNDGRSIKGEFMSAGQFVRDCLALVAEVERLRKIVEAAKAYRNACRHLTAFGSDRDRGIVNEEKTLLFAALDAAEGGE